MTIHGLSGMLIMLGLDLVDASVIRSAGLKFC